MRRRRVATVLAGLLACGAGAGARAGTEAPEWEFFASAYTYLVPDDDDYAQPALTADRGWLHLEARYNYEDRDTASAWIGYNFSLGQDVTLDMTPLLGGVFGETRGIAPGFRAALGWRWLEFYTESEYVFDADVRDDSFFYAWSELTAAPLEWLEVGLVVQRTRAYEAERDVQRGLLVGVRCEPLELTAHVFNPDDGDAVWVFSIGVGF